MRILHCCLANFYIDNYGYQENILPKMHKLQGHEVAILASTETYIDNRVLGYVEPRSYHTEDGIPITRLPYAKGIPHRLAKKLRIYQGLSEAIDSFAPDVFFLHDCQFLGMRAIAQYARTHPRVRIYVDGHTDFMNSARNWISKHILHGLIYKYCAQLIEPYTSKFYGVFPARVDFFRNMYDIPAEKTELLVVGADDTKVDFDRKDEIRSSIRGALDIQDSDFVVVTGGKIDRRKNIHALMRAIGEINQQDIRLIVFGTPSDNMKDEIEALSKHDSINHVGWIASDKTYDYFLASDLAVFPGTHSVLWEQAIGVGLPCIFRRWDGIQHVDLGGNCVFLATDSDAEIKKAILDAYQKEGVYLRMKQIATDKGIDEFSYYNIAERAISE
ncbi:glycosyltransferase family 4 protein [Candidatus Hydrogenedentota bacterium]